MAKPNDADLAALRDAGPLLRFAAERVKNLDPDLSLAIAEAHAAGENDSWTPQISQRFWNAFSKLCDLIGPVTLDCISMAQANIPARSWTAFFGWSGKTVSQAERSSSRYLKLLLFILIAVILPLQLYVWVCTSLSKKLEELVNAEQTKLSPVGEDFRKLTAVTGDKADGTPHDYTSEEKSVSDKIEAYAVNLNSAVDRILYETQLLRALLFKPAGSLSGERKVKNFWFDDYRNAVERFNVTQLEALKVQEASSLIVGVFVAFILPVLFGILGAVAYVIRSISDQVRTTTFFQNSPIRHQMRVALGALMGVVVGLFQGLSGQLSLPPLAIAFLAGYGVEAVFSMFDGLVDRLKEDRRVGASTSRANT